VPRCALSSAAGSRRRGKPPEDKLRMDVELWALCLAGLILLALLLLGG
jgi:hypothetical protein